MGKLTEEQKAELNQYHGGMCISGVLKTTEKTPQDLVSPLGPKWVANRQCALAKCTFHLGFSLEALEKLSDDEIDFSDIPEWPINWSTAKIGMHYKPDWQDNHPPVGPKRHRLVRGTRPEPGEDRRGHQPSPDGPHPAS